MALISGIANREIALEAIECGAAGFLPKNISAKSFISAVKFMIMGEKYIPINFQDLDKSDTIKHDLLSNLTEREIEILCRTVLNDIIGVRTVGSPKLQVFMK